VPLTGGNPIRKVERRIGLSLEYAFKAVYAKIIGVLAGFSPADLRIRSAVADLGAADIAAEPRIVLVRKEGGISVNRHAAVSRVHRNIAETCGAWAATSRKSPATVVFSSLCFRHNV